MVPSPSSGDTYYNTNIKEDMRYDDDRSKWLSSGSVNVQSGRNGDTSPGLFYRGMDGMVLDGANRGIPVQKGTIVYLAISKTSPDFSRLNVLVNGSVVATLDSLTPGLVEADLDNDFDGGLMSFQNDAGGFLTSNVQIRLVYKRRE